MTVDPPAATSRGQSLEASSEVARGLRCGLGRGRRSSVAPGSPRPLSDLATLFDPKLATPLVLQARHNRRLLDGVRALGILLVVLFHAVFGISKLLPPEALDDFVAELPSPLNIAWQALGSEIIFFVSGFLLAALLFQELRATGRLDVRAYLVRRTARIVPLYLLALALYALADPPTAQQWAFNLLFLSNVFDVSTIIATGWSLELMVQVYLALPLLVLWVGRSRRPLMLLLTLVLVSVGVRALPLLADPGAVLATTLPEFLRGAEAPLALVDLYNLTWYRLTPFLMGALLAWGCVHRADVLARAFGTPRRAAAWSLGGLLLVLGASCLPLHDGASFLYTGDGLGVGFWISFWTLQRFVLVLGLAIVLAACLHTRRGLAGILGALLAWRPWGYASRNIYGIYLFHVPWLIPGAALAFWTTEAEAVTHASAWQALTVWLVASACSVLFAAALRRWIEDPARDWMRRRWLG